MRRARLEGREWVGPELRRSSAGLHLSRHAFQRQAPPYHQRPQTIAFRIPPLDAKADRLTSQLAFTYLQQLDDPQAPEARIGTENDHMISSPPLCTAQNHPA
jgi:hypothetical protein